MGRCDYWCPKCGYKKITCFKPRPTLGSVWMCNQCGYEFIGTKKEMKDLPLNGAK